MASRTLVRDHIAMVEIHSGENGWTVHGGTFLVGQFVALRLWPGFSVQYIVTHMLQGMFKYWQSMLRVQPSVALRAGVAHRCAHRFPGHWSSCVLPRFSVVTMLHLA